MALGAAVGVAVGSAVGVATGVAVGSTVGSVSVYVTAVWLLSVHHCAAVDADEQYIIVVSGIAPLSIVVTLSGIVMLAREVQPAKAAL